MNRTGSAPGRTITRPVTRFLCRWVPRRKNKRVFTKADAVRICCAVVSNAQNAATLEEIIVEAKARCGGRVEEGNKAQAAALAAQGTAQVAIFAIGYASSLDSNVLSPALRQTLTLLGVLIAFGIALAAAPIPPIIKAPVVIALRVAQNSLRTFEGTIIRQKAANDAFIDTMREILRQAA